MGSLEVKVVDADFSDEFSRTSLQVLTSDKNFAYKELDKNRFLVDLLNYPYEQLRLRACDGGGRCSIQPMTILIDKISQNLVKSKMLTSLKTSLACTLALPTVRGAKICKLTGNTKNFKNRDDIVYLDSENWLRTKVDKYSTGSRKVLSGKVELH